MSYITASADKIQRLRENGASIVDIREEDEFRREHIPGAISLPLSHNQAGKETDTALGGTQVIFHCQSGSRTQQNAAALAHLAGSGECVLLEGGINAWKQAGLPVEKDRRQPLPVMRQVQITAGSLILLGVIGGYSLTPALFLLSGFVGAGLLFAGISGWCGMALLLAKMPWNRR